MDNFNLYIKTCEKYIPNIPFPHEPMLMSEEQLEKAIPTIKKIGYFIYLEKIRRNKNAAKKGKYAIFSIDFSYGKANITIEYHHFKDMSFNKLYKLKNRIEKYNNKHPEFVYLNAIEKEIKNRNKHNNRNNVNFY